MKRNIGHYNVTVNKLNTSVSFNDLASNESSEHITARLG